MLRRVAAVVFCAHGPSFVVWGVQRPPLPSGAGGVLQVSAGVCVGVGWLSRVFGVAGMRAPPVWM